MPNPSPTPLSPTRPYPALLGPTRPYSALLGPTRPYSAPLGPNRPPRGGLAWGHLRVQLLPVQSDTAGLSASVFLPVLGSAALAAAIKYITRTTPSIVYISRIRIVLPPRFEVLSAKGRRCGRAAGPGSALEPPLDRDPMEAPSRSRLQLTLAQSSIWCLRVAIHGARRASKAPVQAMTLARKCVLACTALFEKSEISWI